MTTSITANVPPGDQESNKHKGKKQFSFGALKQRASMALGGSSSGKQKKKRPVSMMNISVVREGEEGGVPSGVKMDLVPLEKAPPPVQNWLAKKHRAALNFSCNIFAENSEDFNAAMEECKHMVLEAGGKILNITYPGGFLYDMSFASAPNPLDSLDETTGGGYITVEPYAADQIPHPHPLRTHPSRPGAGAAASILEHMARFGLAPNSRLCNGRDKPCASHCQYRPTSRHRPASMNAHTQQDIVTVPRLGDSPPQLEPARRTSLICMEDIFEQANSSAAKTLLSPQRLKRNSKRLSHPINKDDTLTWLEDQETRKQFEQEFNDSKAFSTGMEMEAGKRARPTPIFGTVENNHYVANCRPPIPRRSSSLGRTSSEVKIPDARRDSIITAVHQLPSPIIYSQPSLRLAAPEIPSSLDSLVKPLNSPGSSEPRSPMFSELSADNIVKLQKKLTDIREGLGGT